VNAYWTCTVRIARDDLVWSELLAAFIEGGGDGFYGAYQRRTWNPRSPTSTRRWTETRIAIRTSRPAAAVRAGYVPCVGEDPAPDHDAEDNYFDTDEVDRQAEILAKTIRRFN